MLTFSVLAGYLLFGVNFFQCQKTDVDCNSIFFKSFSVHDSPFSVEKVLSVFSRTAARVTLFTQRCTFGARFAGVFVFVHRYCTQYD